MDFKLKLQDVSYVYSPNTPFENRALEDINLELEAGCTLGIIGHTGSGKSTLIRLLNGLERPTSGTVFVDGEDIWKKPKEINKIRFKVGLVMQYPEYQLFEETVALDIAYGPKNMGLSEHIIEERVRRYSSIVGIDEELLERSPFELSGGQKRRVAIAGIMAMKPNILVLDEPAAGLDPEGRSAIFNAIEEYRKSEDATVIIVSHSMEDMAVRCDKIAVLSHGKLLTTGSVDEIFSSPSLLVEAGLDVPEITTVASLLKEKGFHINKPIFRVDDAVSILLPLLKGGEDE